MNEDAEKYIVLSSRREEGEVRFYFWTGHSFVGDLEQAQVYDSYADCAGAIWDGTLWDATAQIKELGFNRLSHYPHRRAKTDIKATERGEHVLPIGDQNEPVR